MSLQNEVLKTVGAVGVLGGLYKASPEYAEKMRLKGLNKQEIEKRNILDNLVRTIKDPNVNASHSDVNEAFGLRRQIGNLLEQQGKYQEAFDYRRGEDMFLGELENFVPTQKSTTSIENARVTKSMQSDMTLDLRDFYKQVRLGGTI